MFVLPDPPLSEAEMRLRAFDHRDTDAVARAYDDREVLRWFWSDGGERSATAFLRRQAEAWRRGEWASFAVCECEDSCVGAVFLESRDPGICDIGYWLLAEARGRGLAARATRLVAEWGLTLPGVARVQLWMEPENVASQRVAERAGFHREGVLRAYGEREGRRVDAVFYSLVADDVQRARRVVGG
jgi:[ribosomal protein S5]-alanine N-acetyltransferase